MSYTVHTWVTGDTIFAADLNNAEAGIADAHARIDAANTAAASVAAQVAALPTQSYVDTADAALGVRVHSLEIRSFAAVATSGAYSDLTGKPTLATVATTGAYTDLTGKPTIPAAYTDAQAQAVVTSTLVAGSNVSLTPSGSTLIISSTGAGGGGSTNDGDFGVVLLDSFAGASDDAKLTAALSAVAADTYKRTVLLTNRQYNFSTVNRAAFTGMKIMGPGGYSNPDQGTPAPFETHEVHLTGTGPWFTNNNADVWDVSLTQLTFRGGSGATVLGNSDTTHSWWRLHMRDIAAAALKSVLGTQSTAILLTGATLDGFWEINNSYGTAFHLGGSDNRLFTDGGFLDSGTAFNSTAGLPHLWLDFIENTNVGALYITCEGPWAGVQVDGPGFLATASSSQGAVALNGLQIEGRSQSLPSQGALVRVNGGVVRLRDCGLHFGMSSPSSFGRAPVDAGIVHHAGGQLLVNGCTYDRATGVAETVPFVYTASAGKAVVTGIFPLARGGTWTGLPRVGLKTGNAENRITDGTVQLVTV